MKIISHRGNGNIYKSNTKEALLKSLALNYIDGIEFDIRITKDKKIVIMHDIIIDFVSDGSGIVKYMNYSELLNYNFGTKDNISKIVTLDEMLSSINTNKIIMIEIKEETNDFNEFVEIFYEIIKNYNLNIYVISFNYKLLSYLNHFKVNCGLLIGYYINKNKLHNNFNFNIVNYNHRYKVDKKETFLFGILGKDIDKFNILTDKPYLYK